MMLTFQKAADLLATFSPETLEYVSGKIAEAKKMAADGLTLEEVSDFLHGTIDEVMHALAEIASTKLEGETKRQIVLAVVSRLLEVLPALALPGWLAWLPAFLARPLVRQMVLNFAGGVIESLYKLYIAPRMLRLVPPPAA